LGFLLPDGDTHLEATMHNTLEGINNKKGSWPPSGVLSHLLPAGKGVKAPLGLDHTRRDSKKRSRTENAMSKTCRAKQRGAPVEPTCVRNQPLILGSIYFKKRKERVRRIPPSIP